MPLEAFLEALAESGHVSVELVLPPSEPGKVVVVDGKVDVDAVRKALTQMEEIHRLACPAGMPAFHTGPAARAGMWLYRACRCLVSRHLSAENVVALLSGPFADEKHAADPAVHYSVDVVLRYLPDLIRLSRGLSSDDPLNEQLLKTGSQWPLSLVGVRGTAMQPTALDVVLSHAGLRQIYCDRALIGGDVERLSEPRVRDEARAAYGACRTLASPAASAILWPPEAAPA